MVFLGSRYSCLSCVCIHYLKALILKCFSFFSSLFQYINKTGFRACVKELFVNQHDPLSISYAVMPGGMLYKINAIYVIYEKAFISFCSFKPGFQVLWFPGTMQA